MVDRLRVSVPCLQQRERAFLPAGVVAAVLLGSVGSLAGCAGLHGASAAPDYAQTRWDPEWYIHPRTVELRITYSLQGIAPTDDNHVTMYEFSEEPVVWQSKTKSEGPVLLLYVGRQRDYPNQRNVEEVSVDPPPDKTVSRDIDGNVIEYWDLSKAAREGKDITVTRVIRFTAYETAFRIDPAKVGAYNPDDPVYRYYTRTQEFLESTPEVLALARKIVGDETNPYLQARAIYAWCVDNIAYVYPPNRGILYSLPRRTGDCGEYSLIFVALCRAVGIPARVDNGHWCCKAKMNYHVWNEFFLPGYGWVPADATEGRTNKEAPGKLAGNGDPFYFFGNLDSGRFVTSKGTSIQLVPSPPWHRWGLDDRNNNPIFFQTATTVYSGITIKSQKATVEILKGDDVLW